MLLTARTLLALIDAGAKKRVWRKKKKAVRLDRFERGKGGREVSGKAMQDEVEANAKTLGLEKTTTLEEGCIHLKFATSFCCP